MMGFGLLCISLSREIPDEVKTGESRRDEENKNTCSEVDEPKASYTK